MIHLVWIGGTDVQSILSSLIFKVYHAFAFKPITIKFGKFTNFWMLFQMTCPILNIRTKKKYVRTQSPARLEHGQLQQQYLSAHALGQLIVSLGDVILSELLVCTNKSLKSQCVLHTFIFIIVAVIHGVMDYQCFCSQMHRQELKLGKEWIAKCSHTLHV